MFNAKAKKTRNRISNVNQKDVLNRKRRVMLNWEGSLEERCMLTSAPLQAVTSNLSGRNLVISGTELIDKIEVRQFGSVVLINSVTINGGKLVNRSIKRFSISKIDSISVNGNGGNDYIKATIPMRVSGIQVVLDGGSGDDQLESSLPDVTMIGGLGADTLVSRIGYATVDYSAGTSGIVIDLENNVCSSDGLGSSDILLNIANVIGSQHSDYILGNEKNNILKGGFGNDTIYGESGQDMIYGDDDDDILIGGLGNDMIDGGDGSDTVDYSLAMDSDNSQDENGVNVDLISGRASGEGTDRLVNIENVNGSDGKDSINIRTGGRVRGGLGIDQFRIDGVDIIIDGDTSVPLPTNPEIIDLVQETFDRFRSSYLIATSELSAEQRNDLNNSIFRTSDELVNTPISELSQNPGLSLTSGGMLGAATNIFDQSAYDMLKEQFNPGGIKYEELYNSVLSTDYSNTGQQLFSWWTDVENFAKDPLGEIESWAEPVTNVLSTIWNATTNVMIGIGIGFANSIIDVADRLSHLGNPFTANFYYRFVLAFAIHLRDIAVNVVSSVVGGVIDILGDFRGELFGRKLHSDEKQVAKAVFGNKLNLSKIRIVENPVDLNLGSSYVQGSTIVAKPPESVLLDEFLNADTGTFNKKWSVPNGILSPLFIDTFVHELVHIYQKSQLRQSPTATKVKEFFTPGGPVDNMRSEANVNILGSIPDPRDEDYSYTLTPSSTWKDFDSRTEPQAVMVENVFIFLETVKAIENARLRSIQNKTSLRHEILLTDPNTVPKMSWDLIYSEEGLSIIEGSPGVNNAFSSNKKFEGYPNSMNQLTSMYPFWNDHFRIMSFNNLFPGTIDYKNGGLNNWVQQTRKSS